MKQSLGHLRRNWATQQPSLTWQWLWPVLQRLLRQPEPQIRRVRFQGQWQWQAREGDVVQYFDRDRDVVIWLESRYR
ncbi:MAG: hypothetical protein HC926_00830 [Synechococcaceae cyanobacterium SM2_3_60]|nr:hypothetical protein [Synechococcaceae cyanobacterium SM2_3_60]